MNDQRRRIFALFFLSGFCGLVYQTVWIRLAFASYGVVMPVLSVVVSVFMLGLALGSWAGGRWIGPLTARTGRPAVLFYALTELFIATGALAVPRLMSWGEDLLLRAGPADSFAYLLFSALLLAASLLPWCFAIGLTLPVMMAHLQKNAERRLDFGFLYAANTLGAVAGVAASALVLLEVLGFRQTLLTAGVLNVFVALFSLTLGRAAPQADGESADGPRADLPRGAALGLLFATGAAGLGMEVAWTRGFTPVLGTQVYAFAFLLFVYLAATWAGAALHRRRPDIPVDGALALLPAAALLPIVLNNPVLTSAVPPALRGLLRTGLAPLSIVPFCALLGFLTPALIDSVFGRDPKKAGAAYAVNAAGCILGPLLTSYLLLPSIGFRYTLMVLAAPLAAFALRRRALARRRTAAVLGALVLAAALASRSYEEPASGVVRRDHTATVVSIGAGMGRLLLVNGIGMTVLTTDTKLMAHLPMLALGRPPETALSICFGMGTSHRSLLSWGARATAVELVPSVLEAFGYYFDDAAEVRANPLGEEVVDDGRRFLRRSREKFDVVVIDPPPPMESAGSSLLYSEEFYSLIKTRMTEGAVLQQWLPYQPGGDLRILRSMAGALRRSFRRVRALRSADGWGFHFLASDGPLALPPPAAAEAAMPPSARRDLSEWSQGASPAAVLAAVYAGETDVRDIAPDGSPLTLTDDEPVNEYFLVRRLLAFFLHPR